MGAVGGNYGSYSGPQRIEIVGPVATVRFPNLCTRCAGPPAGALTVTKMFRRVGDDSATQTVFASVRAPFCAACLAEHERDLPPVEPKVIGRLRRAWLLRALPYIIPVFCIGFLLMHLVPDLVRRVLRGPQLADIAIFGGVIAFFVVMLLWFLRTIWAGRLDLVASGAGGDPNASYVEIVRAPPGMVCVIPGPPTATKSAVDFTDDQSSMFEPDKHFVTLANPVVFEHFQALNADRVWDRHSPRAQRAKTARWIVLALVLLAGAALLLRDLLGW